MRRLRQTCTAVAAALLVIVGGAATANAAPTPAAVPAAAPSPVTYYAQAYGTNLSSVGGILRSGATALAQLSCTGLAGLYKANTTAAVNLGGLGSLGTTVSHTATIATSTTRESAANNTVAHVDLLNHLITASAVTARSASVRTSSGLSAHQSASLVGLKIAGKSISANVAPNTTITVSAPGYPKVAQVILNQQAGSRTSTYVSSADVAIRVRILTANPFQLKIGTDLIVARAGTRLSPYQTGYLSGHAAGSYVSVAGTGIVSGYTADALLSCGTGSSTNRVAGVNLGALAQLGVITSTAVSNASPTYAVGTPTSTIASASILGSVIKAGVIRAGVSASRYVGDPVALRDSSSFGSLSVVGFPAINANVAPNTKITVPRLGSVTFHYVTKTSNAIYVAMIDITLNTTVSGLAPGTRILIGYATSSVNS